MNIIKFSIFVVCFLCFGEKQISANLIHADGSHYFLGQLIKIFSSCEPTYKLTYFDIRGWYLTL